MTTRAPLRLVYISGIVLLVVIVSFYLKSRQRALNCRSLHSCFSSPPEYQYSVAEETVFTTTNTTLHDGTLQYTRRITANPNIIFMVLTRDSHSWSADMFSTHRTAYDFLDVLVSTGLNLTDVSLGIMTATRSEYDRLIEATATLPFGRVTIYHHVDTGATFAYGDRHKPAVQLERRAAIAERRNTLMLRALEDEDHILWMDADVVEFSPNIVQTMLQHADDDVERNGIITARCMQGRWVYDNNAWRIDWDALGDVDTVTSGSQQGVLKKFIDTRKYLDEILQGSQDGDLVPLDAVGGTLLYIRSSLVRRGVNFPPFNVIGTTWRHEGWIGLETEGLCYMAKRLPGGGSGCWVLGGSGNVIRHTDWG